ncbi:MAG: DUF2314 domain-containing protein [Acidobacteria bacterium]|nr:DUF2314 domain-containing protein [Acidobacteriota bacterium]
MWRRDLAAIVLLILAAWGKGLPPDKLVQGGYDQKELEVATARARQESRKFIGLMMERQGEDFVVKARIQDSNGTEHFWLENIRYVDGEFSGVISNEPGIVKNVRVGQSCKIKESDIEDWMFRRDGKIHGNYTMRPLVKSMPPEEAARYRELLAEP